ncbi:FAD binding domain-containing protein [Bacteroidota bacterium]
MVEDIKFILNNDLISIDYNSTETLLDFLRKGKKLVGTKEGCREGDCGACTVMVGSLGDNVIKYRTINSCLYSIGKVVGKHVVTIEGLNSTFLNLIQESFLNKGASQCGFCTPGFVVSFTCYLINNNNYELENAIRSIAGNICRCTGYLSIKRALEEVLNKFSIQKNRTKDMKFLIKQNILPQYFNNIESRLILLNSESQDFLQEKTKDQFILGGGTDIYIQEQNKIFDANPLFTERILKPEIVVENLNCKVSGSVTFEMLNESEIFKQYFPEIETYMDLIASLQIRNSATLAGNIVNASPIGDLTIFFLALDAEIELSNFSQKRVMKLKDLFLDYKKLDKTDDELLTWINFILPDKNSKFNFIKVSKRTHLDIASVNSAILIKIHDDIVKDVNLSLGGVAPVPLYLKKSTTALKNRQINNLTILDFISQVQKEINPISDIRGSVKYKRFLVSQIIKKHFIQLFPEKVVTEEIL